MNPRGIGKQSPSGRTILLSVLVWGVVLLGGFELQTESALKPLQYSGQNVFSDTTAPIEEKACTSYEWFRTQTKEYWRSEDYGSLFRTHTGSLHELTCRWAAYRRGLSFDSTRLPKYVQPVGDSLRMGDFLAYSVKMTAPETLDFKELIFVAEVGDSLFYTDFARSHVDGNPESLQVRSIRPIDVDSTPTQYIWYEYAEITRGDKDPTSVYEQWIGRILAYDPRRGMRSLHKAPVRAEARKGDEVLGVKQWDVSVPEPGIMRIQPRLEKGGDVSLAPRGWLGKHVIDRSATSKREVDLPRDASNRTFLIDTTEVENWRETYDQ